MRILFGEDGVDAVDYFGWVFAAEHVASTIFETDKEALVATTIR